MIARALLVAGLLAAFTGVSPAASMDPGRAAPFVTESPDTVPVFGAPCAIAIDPATDRPILFATREAVGAFLTPSAPRTSIRFVQDRRAWSAEALPLGGAFPDDPGRLSGEPADPQGFAPEIEVAIRNASHRAFATDGDGVVHAVYVGAGGLRYATSRGEIEVVDATARDAVTRAPAIELEPNGAPHVVYLRDGYVLHARRPGASSDGASAPEWSPERVGACGDADACALALTRDGRALVLYATTEPTRSLILATAEHDAYTYEVIPTERPVLACAIALDRDETPHVAFTAGDADDARLLYATRALHGVDVEGGRAPALTVRAGPGVRMLTARVRRGGDVAFAGPLTLDDTDGDGTFRTPLDPALVGPRGLELVIDAPDAGISLGTPETPVRWRVVSQLTAPTGEGATRLLATPVDVFGSRNLMNAISGDDAWHVSTWDARAQTTRPLDASDVNAVAPGRAFWAQAPPTASLVVVGGSVFPPPGSDYFEIPLAPGWNLIGNPAAYPISLDRERLRVETPVLEKSFARASTDGQVHGTIYTFDPANVDSAGHRFGARMLDVWEGAWIRNETSATLTLRIPARALTAREVDAARAPAAPTPLAWQLLLTARTETEGSAVALAFAEHGESQIDVLDVRSPPRPPGAALRVAIVHAGDILTGGPVELYRDVRDATYAEADWRIAVHAPERVTLTWESPVRDPGQPAVDIGSLVLVDPRGDHWDMTVMRSVVLPAGEHELIVTARTNPSPAPVPVAFDASVRPNPFHAETIFRYELPEAGAVRLGVFDITGRRIWSHEERAASAGGHAVLWDGRDTRAQRVQPGTYFLRVEREGAGRRADTLTRKMTVLP